MFDCIMCGCFFSEPLGQELEQTGKKARQAGASASAAASSSQNSESWTTGVAMKLAEVSKLHLKLDSYADVGGRSFTV